MHESSGCTDIYFTKSLWKHMMAKQMAIICLLLCFHRCFHSLWKHNKSLWKHMMAKQTQSVRRGRYFFNLSSCTLQ